MPRRTSHPGPFPAELPEDIRPPRLDPVPTPAPDEWGDRNRYWDQSHPALEQDPNGTPAGQPGSKLDAGKDPVYRGALAYFPRAIRAIAHVSLVGANKYTWKGWETVPDGQNRYLDALGRHLCDETIEGPKDQSGLLHRAQVAWNAMAALELYLQELGEATKNSAEDEEVDEITDFIRDHY